MRSAKVGTLASVEGDLGDRPSRTDGSRDMVPRSCSAFESSIPGYQCISKSTKLFDFDLDLIAWL